METKPGEQPEPRRRRTGKRVPRRTSVGVRGPEALDLLYRLGALTAPHLSQIGGASKSVAQSTLQSLRENGICESRDRPLPWAAEKRGRAPAHYFLSNRSGGAGIVEGAAAAGHETRGKRSRKAAIGRYSYTGVPEHVTHLWLRNEFFCRLLKGARAFEDRALVPTAAIYGEGCPDFPLGQKEGGSSQGTVRPDGRFSFGMPTRDGNDTYTRTFYVEAETHPRRAEALRKTRRHLDAWWSMVGFWKSAAEFAGAGFGPLVFVYPTASLAKGVWEYVSRRIEEDAAGGAAAGFHPLRALRDAFKRMGVQHDPGRYVLFCGLDEIASSRDDGAGAVWGRAYLPLSQYPEEVTGPHDEAVRLADVLIMLYALETSRPVQGGPA